MAKSGAEVIKNAINPPKINDMNLPRTKIDYGTGTYVSEKMIYGHGEGGAKVRIPVRTVAHNRQRNVMNRATWLLTLPVVIFVGVALILLSQRFGAAENPEESTELKISDAKPYRPKDGRPGVRVSIPLYASKYVFPLELDVHIKELLAGDFEVADATVRTAKSERNVYLTGSQRPSLDQDPPKSVAARVLLLHLDPGEYFVDFYLRGKNEYVDPEKAAGIVTSGEGLRVSPVVRR